MEEIKNCPVCGQTEKEEVFKGPYYRGNSELFSIQRCKACQFWFTSPRPTEGEELNAYYDTGDYVSHTEKSETLVDKLYMLVRGRALKSKLALLNGLHPQKGALLDYGAGAGAFLVVAKADNWQTKGVEPSSVACKQASLKGLSLYQPENTEAFALPNHYSAISLWHVLEHLPKLNESLASFFEWLKPGGTLILALPNHDSYDAKKYQENWAALDLPLHLYHFTKSDIKALADKHGFVLQTVKNMPFDSFYVSMLSEKIRGKGHLVSAFATGLLSNIKGAATTNMSSLIYVLKKP
jgi:SAM-dependent methyltransferase